MTSFDQMAFTDPVGAAECRDAGRFDGHTIGAFALTRRDDPETSKAAAASVGSGVEKAIRAAFTLKDWAADDLCDYLEPALYPPTVKSALARLHKSGWLEDSGERRLSHRDREQIVWRRA